jgi:WD40 repeat protein
VGISPKQHGLDPGQSIEIKIWVNLTQVPFDNTTDLRIIQPLFNDSHSIPLKPAICPPNAINRFYGDQHVALVDWCAKPEHWAIARDWLLQGDLVEQITYLWQKPEIGAALEQMRTKYQGDLALDQALALIDSTDFSRERPQLDKVGLIQLGEFQHTSVVSRTIRNNGRRVVIASITPLSWAHTTVSVGGQAVDIKRIVLIPGQSCLITLRVLPSAKPQTDNINVLMGGETLTNLVIQQVISIPGTEQAVDEANVDVLLDWALRNRGLMIDWILASKDDQALATAIERHWGNKPLAENIRRHSKSRPKSSEERELLLERVLRLFDKERRPNLLISPEFFEHRNGVPSVIRGLTLHNDSLHYLKLRLELEGWKRKRADWWSSGRLTSFNAQLIAECVLEPGARWSSEAIEIDPTSPVIGGVRVTSIENPDVYWLIRARTPLPLPGTTEPAVAWNETNRLVKWCSLNGEHWQRAIVWLFAPSATQSLPELVRRHWRNEELARKLEQLKSIQDRDQALHQALGLIDPTYQLALPQLNVRSAIDKSIFVSEQPTYILEVLNTGGCYTQLAMQLPAWLTTDLQGSLDLAPGRFAQINLTRQDHAVVQESVIRFVHREQVVAEVAISQGLTLPDTTQTVLPQMPGELSSWAVTHWATAKNWLTGTLPGQAGRMLASDISQHWRNQALADAIKGFSQTYHTQLDQALHYSLNAIDPQGYGKIEPLITPSWISPEPDVVAIRGTTQKIRLTNSSRRFVLARLTPPPWASLKPEMVSIPPGQSIEASLFIKGQPLQRSVQPISGNVVIEASPWRTVLPLLVTFRSLWPQLRLLLNAVALIAFVCIAYIFINRYSTDVEASQQAAYQRGIAAMERGDYTTAQREFRVAATYSDASAQLSTAYQLQIAQAIEQQRWGDGAIAWFSADAERAVNEKINAQVVESTELSQAIAVIRWQAQKIALDWAKTDLRLPALLAVSSDNTAHILMIEPNPIPTFNWKAFIYTEPIKDSILLRVDQSTTTVEIPPDSREGAFSPDGRVVAIVGAKDHGITLLRDGVRDEAFMGHTDVINSIAFTPQSDKLVSASTDRSVRIWAVSNGRVEQVLSHPQSVSVAVFSADGKQVLSGDTSGAIRIWNTADGVKVSELVPDIESDQVTMIATDPMGQIAAATYANGKLRVWQLDVSTLLYTADIAAQPDHILTFTQDGQTLIVGAGNEIMLFRATDGSVVQVLREHQDTLRSLALGNNGQTLFSSGNDKKIIAWQARSRVLSDPGLASIVNQTQNAAAQATAYQPLQAAIGRKEWLAAAQSFISLEGQNRSAPELARIFASSSELRQAVEVLRWQTKQSREVQTFTTPFGHLQIAVNDNASTITTLAVEDGFLFLKQSLLHGSTISLSSDYSGTLGPDLGSDPAPDTVVTDLSHDGTLWAQGSSRGAIALWRADNGKVLQRLQEDQQVGVQAIAFAPTARFLAAGMADGTVMVWEIAEKATPLPPLNHQSPVTALAWNDDSTLLAVGFVDGTVLIYTIPTQQLLQTWNAHTVSITSLAFAHSLPLLATGSDDTSIRLWQVGNTTELDRLEGHTSPLTKLVFSPDDTTLASGGRENRIYLWRVQDGLLLQSDLAGHTGLITDLAFSADGRVLVSAGEDKTIRVWRTPNESVIDPALLTTLDEAALAPTLPAIAPTTVTEVSPVPSAKPDRPLQSGKVVNVAPRTLRVRASTSISESTTIVARLNEGEVVVILSTAQAEGRDWYQIRSGQVEGWVDADYIELVQP